MMVFCLLLSVCFLSPVKAQWFFTTQYTLNPFTPFIEPVYQPQTIAPPPPSQYEAYNNNNNNNNDNNPSQRSTGEYRGFSYQTNFDGATTSVFFVTGPESDQLRNSINFPEFRTKDNNNNNNKVFPPNRARNLASNIEDGNAIENPSNLIRNLLKPDEFKILFDQQPNGVTHFYSYPANTVPLPQARQLSLDDGNDTISSTTETTTTTTTTNSSPESTTKEDVVGSETIISSRILANDIDKEKNSTSTTIATLTTAQSTTTTEAVQPSTTTPINLNNTDIEFTTPTTNDMTTSDEIVTIMNEETTTQV